MASKKEVCDNVKVRNDAEKASGTINNGEDTGKDSDIDVIFEEMAKENAIDSDKSNLFSIDKSRKAAVNSNTSKKRASGSLVQKDDGRVKPDVPKIPQGILYVKNHSFKGFHCTYCNCSLNNLSVIKQHVVGARHQENLKTKKIKGGSKTGRKAGLPSASPVKKIALKSSLIECLKTVTEPIVGLGHIVEIITLNKPSKFECNICNFISNADGMKEHITGTRHRLTYLKTSEPKKLAEMMSKNLNKNERNQKILDIAKELEKEHGQGSIVVKSLETAESQGSIRRGRESARGRGRGSLHGGTMGSIYREMRDAQGGRGGYLNRENRTSLPRMNENRRQAAADRFRSHGVRGASEPYNTRGAYNADYSKWMMGTRSDYCESYHDRGTRYPDPYPRENYMEDKYERIDQQSPRYDYRQHYEDEPSRQYGPPDAYQNRECRSTSPNWNRSSYHNVESVDVEANSSKNLPSFKVTNEKDAGLVMNVITSLAESLLGYKMGNSGSPQEILQKLEEEKRMFAGHSNESDIRGTEKFSKASDVADPPSHSWSETGETRARHLDTYQGRNLSPPRRQMDSVRDRSPPRRSVDVRDRSPPTPRRPMDIVRDRSPPLSRKPMEVMRDRSPLPQRRQMGVSRDWSSPLPRRSMDVGRDRSPAQRRPMDVIRDRSPPAQRRPMDVIRDRSPPRMPMDVMQDQSSPAARMPIDVMQDLSSFAPRRSVDVMKDQSLFSSRRPMDMQDQSSPFKRPIDVMQTRSPSLSRRSVDIIGNRSPPRGSTGMQNRSPPLGRGPVGIMRDRSSSPLRNHPSYVDDMFDNYQKSQSAMRGVSVSTTSSTPSGYRSSLSSPFVYGTPASYASPSFNTNSTFNRPIETRQLTPTGGFVDNQEKNVLDWKYRSLR